MTIGRLTIEWAPRDDGPRWARCAAGCVIAYVGPLFVEWVTRACDEQWDFTDDGKPIRPARKGTADA